jgi:dienelactone hydrolase
MTASAELPEDHVTRKRVVLRLPGMDEVRLQSDVEYPGADGPLTFDLYSPAGPNPVPRGVVVSVAGYPDPGMERRFGCRTKDMGASKSWGRLIASSGLAAVTYENREPARDIHALLEYLRRNGSALGVDPGRVGLIASSGHAPLAISTLIDDRSGPPLRCAALICPLLLDLDGSTAVAEMAKTFRFANPAAGKSVADIPVETAFFIARAGKDEMPGLNETLDRFVAKALARDLSISLVNLPDAPHAFDLQDNREISRDAVRSALSFLRLHLADR